MKSAKVRVRSRIIQVPLFVAEVVIFEGPSKVFLPQLQKMLLKPRFAELSGILERVGPPADHIRGTTYLMSGGGSIVWLKPGALQNTVIHELVHAAIHMLESKGMPLSEDTNEVYAYLVAHLCDEALDR